MPATRTLSCSVGEERRRVQDTSCADHSQDTTGALTRPLLLSPLTCAALELTLVLYFISFSILKIMGKLTTSQVYGLFEYNFDNSTFMTSRNLPSNHALCSFNSITPLKLIHEVCVCKVFYPMIFDLKR